MFAHTTTLWFVACPDPAEQLRRGPIVDPDRTDDFMRRAYTDDTPSAIAVTDLSALPDADLETVFAADFGELIVLGGRSLSTATPDELTAFVADLQPGWTALLLSLDPETNTGVFARWEDGELRRAFSASPSTIVADDGLPFGFESPFWSGARPLQYLPGVVPNPLDLPFHPVELAEESNRQWLGFRFTPPPVAGDTDLTRIPVYAYRLLSADADGTPAADVGPAPAPQTPAPIVVTEPTPDPVPARVPEPAPVEVTTPIAVTEAEPAGRRPGPISRYFGFRGRL